MGFVFLALVNKVFGQNLPPIQLDRPDQTECPFITPKQYIQIENGFNIENAVKGIKNYTFPSSLWKYGINEKLELRLITELVHEDHQLGLKPITIGFKTALFEENGIIPKTSFIGHITSTTIGTPSFHTNYIAPAFRFTMQHTISEKISLAYNLGAEWDGMVTSPSYLYTLTTGYSINSKLGAYMEAYGFLSNHSTADNRLDGGFTYLINNDFIIDLSGGLGVSATAPNNYISFGISYRFKH
jgi:hypothetical protein